MSINRRHSKKINNIRIKITMGSAIKIIHRNNDNSRRPMNKNKR